MSRGCGLFGVLAFVAFVLSSVVPIEARGVNHSQAASLLSACSCPEILVYSTRATGTALRATDFDEDLPAILALDGYSVSVFDRASMPTLSAAVLAGYDQLWLISTETPSVLSPTEVQAINDFRAAGKGVMVIGDGCAYNGPANQVSPAWSVRFTNSRCCDCSHCSGGDIGCPISTAGFLPHEIWDGVSEIQANVNEGDLEVVPPGEAEIIASHNGINMVAVSTGSGVRVAWDATVYRFSDASAHPILAVTQADNPRYVRNLAKWLCPCPQGPITVALDIKPGSCPNPFNTKVFGTVQENGKANEKGGVLPVAIVGSEDFDVSQIDVGTVRLEGLKPLRFAYEDVTAPVAAAEACECASMGPDGFIDLTLKFQSSDLAELIGDVADGTVVSLMISGTLIDGTSFEGTDCVRVLSKTPPEPDFFSQTLLRSAVPNPFNPSTRIGFVLPRESFVTLSVYDVNGRLVEQLVSGVRGAGDHVVEWDATRMASGIYFYRIDTGDYQQTRKMLLIK